VVKVGKKVFVFLGRAGGGLSLSVKLPESHLLALDLPFASPTGYGLARGGWVTATFEPGDRPPLDLLRRWIEESYAAVAPRARVAELEADGTAPARRRSGGRQARPRHPGRR